MIILESYMQVITDNKNLKLDDRWYRHLKEIQIEILKEEIIENGNKEMLKY
jgi:hypothetical protein